MGFQGNISRGIPQGYPRDSPINLLQGKCPGNFLRVFPSQGLKSLEIGLKIENERWKIFPEEFPRTTYWGISLGKSGNRIPWGSPWGVSIFEKLPYIIMGLFNKLPDIPCSLRVPYSPGYSSLPEGMPLVKAAPRGDRMEVNYPILKRISLILL